MDRLDELIADIGYLHDCLQALRNIWELNDCNKCKKRLKCKYVPQPGQMVRYNCPLFEGDKHDRY